MSSRPCGSRVARTRKKPWSSYSLQHLSKPANLPRRGPTIPLWRDHLRSIGFLTDDDDRAVTLQDNPLAERDPEPAPVPQEQPEFAPIDDDARSIHSVRSAVASEIGAYQAATYPRPPSPAPSGIGGQEVDDANERADLRMLIGQYEKAFPQHCKRTAPATMTKATTVQLKAIYERHQRAIQVAQAIRVANAMFFMTSETVENIARWTPLKLDGFTAALRANEELEGVLLELTLKHAKFVMLTPEQRLMAILATTALAVHKSNTINTALQRGAVQAQQTAEVLEQPPSAEYTKKYAHLQHRREQARAE